MHPQTWIKTNTQVDTAIAEIVSLLNTIEGLETLQSCQGDIGEREGYVYFVCGDWRKMCEFVFETIGPILKNRVDEDARLIIEATSRDAPMAKLSFRAEATNMVVSALKEALS